MKIDLPGVAIDAANEIQRVKLKKVTDLKSVKELSNLLKEEISKLAKKDFSHRGDYLIIFSNAYSSTYPTGDSKLTTEDSKQYMELISKKLESPSNLENKELEKLLDFFVNLSNSSAAYEEKFARSPCFLAA